MQAEITDEAAITFSERLYTALAQGFPIDAALTQARKAIFAAGSDVEFGTPVLFLRGENAQLFDVEGAEKLKELPVIELEPEPQPKPQPKPEEQARSSRSHLRLPLRHRRGSSCPGRWRARGCSWPLGSRSRSSRAAEMATTRGAAGVDRETRSTLAAGLSI